MNNLGYKIEADDSQALAASARVNKSFDAIETSAKKATTAAGAAFASMAATIVSGSRSAEQAFTAAGHAVQSMTGFLVKASEAAVAVYGAFAIASGALGHYAAAVGGASTVTDGLVNSYRLLRIALSPTLFTAATLGVGILAEETLKLVNARGKLIEQQAFVSASRGIPFADVERIGATSKLSGANAADTTAALYALRQNIGSSTVQGALEALSVPKYYRSSADPELLTQVAKGLSDITDPVKRAQAAVDLFGDDLAGRVLPQLNTRFAESSRAVDDWALTLDEASRSNVYVFRRDIQNLKDDVLSLGTGFQGAWQKITQAVVEGSAEVYSNLRTLGAQIAEFQEQSSRKEPRYISRGLALLFGSNRELDRIAGLSKDDIGVGSDLSIQRGAAGTLRDEARAALDRGINTREGLEAHRGAALALQAHARAALEANRGNGPTAGKLSPLDVVNYSAEFLGAVQEINATKAGLQGIDAGKRQVEALRASRELLYRSAFDPAAGRDLRGEILKSTSFVDQDGNLDHYRLLDETRRNLESSFHIYARDLNRKASQDQIKAEEEGFHRRLAFESALWQRRQQFAEETSRLELATIDRVFAHQNDVAGYRRDEQLQSLEIGAPDTVRGRLALVRNRLGIQQRYVTTTSLNDAEGIVRQKDRQLQDLAVDRFTNRIDDGQYFDRRQAIEKAAAQQGAALNDKYQHDLITAQQNAAIESTRIVEEAQHKQFDSLRQSAMGVLDALESHSKNVFQAIGGAIKAALLTAFNEVVSSQIAAGLFRLLNPGATVSFDRTGGGVGRFGRFGSILGGIGLGTQPTFGGSSGFGGYIPAAAVPNGPLTFGESPGAPTSIDSSPAYTGSSQEWKHWGGGDSDSGTVGAGNDSSLDSQSAQYAAAASVAIPLPLSSRQHDAILKAAQPGIFGGGRSSGLSIAGLKDYVFNSGSISVGPGLSTTAAGISQSLGGGIIGALGGGLAGFAASPAGGALGGSLLLGGLSHRSTVRSSIQTVAGGALLGANLGATLLPSLGLAGGALVGGGAALGADGLKRGGLVGLGEDVAGGALIGFQFGGPVGALVGAAIGGVAGAVRLFVPTAREHIRDLVQKTYHITVSSSIVDQIKSIADKDFRGQYSVAIRSTQIQELLSLYAQSTGQNFPIRVAPRPFEGAYTNGELYQVATSYNGRSVGFDSSLPTLPGYGISQYTPIGYGSGLGTTTSGPLSIQLDGPATTALLSGVAVQSVAANPRVVARANNQAQSQNSGRLQSQANLLSPGTVFG